MPVGDEAVVVTLAVVPTVMVAVPDDPEPSLAVAVTVTVADVLPALNNPVESMAPPPATVQVTGTFAVNWRNPPVFTVAPEGEMNTSVEFEPPQDNNAANRQHNGMRMTAFFNPGTPKKMKPSCWERD
jgi:hypothetical protein